MKTILLFLILLMQLVSCDEPISPPCTIGHLEVGTANNILFIRDCTADTIHFGYNHPQYGYLTAYWGSETKWECIGFTYTEDFTLNVWTETDSCTLTINNQ